MPIKRIIALLLTVIVALCGCSVNSIEDRMQDNSGEPYIPPEGDMEELTVYSFNAGKADAHLIYNSRMAVLIDCGEKGFGKEIVSYLNEHGIEQLDLLIITHFDKDHVGGAAKVINDIPVARVFRTNIVKKNKEYEEFEEALKEKGINDEIPISRHSILIGGGELTVCPPLKDYYQDSPSNNSSLITILRYGECSLLFMGDAEDVRITEFLNTEGGRYDYVKMPYHGHYQNKLMAFIKVVMPKTAVITCSEAEPEDPRVMGMLTEAGSEVYLTRNGAVEAKCNGKKIAARVAK